MVLFDFSKIGLPTIQSSPKINAGIESRELPHPSDFSADVAWDETMKIESMVEIHRSICI